MKIFLISQQQNCGYDTYDSAVVVADCEESAREIIPQPGAMSAWTFPLYVKVEYIGEADEKYTKETVICASYNAG